MKYILAAILLLTFSFASAEDNSKVMKENMCVVTYRYYQVCHHVAQLADGDRKKCGEAAANLYITAIKDYGISKTQAWDLTLFCGSYCRIVNFNDPFPKFSVFRKTYCGIQDKQ